MKHPLAYRELYAPAHFGNSYEVIWPGEMKDLLSEAKFWGFNVYGDWFDFIDLKDPYDNPKNHFLMPQALWERKISHYRSAMKVGLSTNLLVSPNHVFMDQLAPPLLADTSDKRYFGQLLCPSIPEAREVILKNYRNLFKDFQEQGVRLDVLSGCPFDYGGCACAKCDPWIVAFGKIFSDIHDMAKGFFPGIEARLAGWWWTAKEHDLFKAWADREKPGLFKSLASHIPYGKTSPDNPMVFPEKCEPHAFVHIVYSDANPPDDRYGPWGPVVAPERMAATVADLVSKGYTGYMAYSEGMCDDVNKALLAGISSGKATDAVAVLEAYAERYFKARGKTKKEWAEWLASWGLSFKVDIKKARKQFNRLAKAAPDTWRLRQFDAKLDLFEAHQETSRMKGWGPRRLAAADRFFVSRERIQRTIWGLGLVRHGLNQNYHQPEWHKEWLQLKKKKAQAITGNWVAEA